MCSIASEQEPARLKKYLPFRCAVQRVAYLYEYTSTSTPSPGNRSATDIQLTSHLHLAR
jgi:hypothetical protein